MNLTAVNHWMQKEKEQRDSVREKDTPFRVVFTFPISHHYQYFETYEEALKADDRSCRYSPYGGLIVEDWRYKRIQKRGPRGGWSNYKPAPEQSIRGGQ